MVVPVVTVVSAVMRHWVPLPVQVVTAALVVMLSLSAMAVPAAQAGVAATARTVLPQRFPEATAATAPRGPEAVTAAPVASVV